MVSFFLRSLLTGILLAVLLAGPAAADILTPTVTHVRFYQDCAPYNGSVTFSVNCTGCYWDMKEWKVPNTCNQEEVFSYSAVCPSFDCVIYENFYLNYRETYRCDITGETEGMRFTISNVSTTPVPANCTSIEPAVAGTGVFSAGKTTPEYESCMERFSLKDCDRFLVPCRQEGAAQEEGDCGWYTTADNRSMKTTPAFGTCLNNTRELQKSCDTYLRPVNDTPVPLWRSGDTEMPAQRVCELMFMLPSKSPPEQVSPVPTPSGKNPFASLYCRLPSFFGKRC